MAAVLLLLLGANIFLLVRQKGGDPEPPTAEKNVSEGVPAVQSASSDSAAGPGEGHGASGEGAAQNGGAPAPAEDAYPPEGLETRNGKEPSIPEGAEAADGQKTPGAERAQPPEMAQLLDEAGYALGDIPGTQLIVVKAAGNTASVYAFDADGSGVWELYLDKTAGHTGKNGVTKSKKEGDGKTPAGLFSLPGAFGLKDDPGCLLPYRKVGEESYWVDDPDSAYYNQWAEGVQNKDWNSAEHLQDYPKQYAYAVVIGYNIDPIVSGNGSAIFLHCGGNPTSGCVSLSQDELVKLMKWLDPERNPYILIF